MLVNPYVGIVRKLDGGSNGYISNYTTTTRLGASVTHVEASFLSAALANETAKTSCQQR